MNDDDCGYKNFNVFEEVRHGFVTRAVLLAAHPLDNLIFFMRHAPNDGMCTPQIVNPQYGVLSSTADASRKKSEKTKEHYRMLKASHLSSRHYGHDGQFSG